MMKIPLTFFSCPLLKQLATSINDVFSPLGNKSGLLTPSGLANAIFDDNNSDDVNIAIPFFNFKLYTFDNIDNNNTNNNNITFISVNDILLQITEENINIIIGFIIHDISCKTFFKLC